jgi:hypothetical protein
MIFALALMSVVYLYGAALASFCLLRDETLLTGPKLFRLLGVWMIPIIGAMLALRSAAEVSPQSLPGRWWLAPLVPLFRVRPSSGDPFPQGRSPIDAAEQQQPGQTRSLW